MADTCFVITPIGKPNSAARVRADRLCEHVLKPALDGHDIKVVRGD